MKYTGQYWIMIAPFMKRLLAKQYGRKAAREYITKAKPIYRQMLVQAEDIGAKNPMAHNVYMSFVFMAIWKAADGAITPDSIVSRRWQAAELFAITGLWEIRSRRRSSSCCESRGEYMIRLTNLTEEELKKIGRSIGEAFYDEGEGLFPRLDREDAITALEIMTECYYRLGVFYTTSERQEGYLAYWRKDEAKAWGVKMVSVSLHMAWRFLRELPFGSLKKLLPLMNNPYEKIYQKKPDYVVISMVAVRREFQGQGFLHVLLGEPFRIARERKIPCVLDTDTELKVKKYISCGMKKTAETPIKGGGTMHTMGRDYRDE